MTAVESIIEKLQKRIDSQAPYIEKYGIPDCRLYLYKILEECMQALEMEKQQSQDYAKFAINCDRKEMPILNFIDYIKL
jgi:hypothetical protein